MRLQHKYNHGWFPPVRVDPVWAARVEREAALHTAAGERAYQRAEKALAKAEARLQKLVEAAPLRTTRKQIAEAEALVEMRRQELLALHREMTASPASSQHRGDRSHRGIPGTQPL